MKTLSKLVQISAILATCLLMGGCDDVRVYGSVGYSSYGGYGGYGGYGSSVRIGGRIY
jgi:hypothetical protein